MRLRSGVWALVLGISACGGSAPPDHGAAPGPAPASTATMPATIPALREWQAAQGRYQWGSASRILFEPALQSVAATFADDLARLTGVLVPVVAQDAATLAPGDIRLALGDSDERLGDEGYRLQIAAAVTVSARTAAGAFYGTRSLLQLLHQRRDLPGGEALDWPRYPERGLMVDMGRKYFSPDWLQARVREMAWLKMNELHLHFSDNEGFRIESERHPEIVSAEHLSKAEVAELVALAERYFIRVIPELDLPGHLTAALTPHPEFQLADATGQRDPALLDITNADAVSFARELLEEFLPLFPGAQWHTGGDEYLGAYDYPRYPGLQLYAQDRYGTGANGKDAVHGFLNDTTSFLAGHGKTTRAWQDDLGGGNTVTVNPDIVVEWWTNFSPLGDLVLVPTPQALLDSGHSIINSGWFPTYYVVGGAFGIGAPVPAIANMKDAYENWAVNEFYGPLLTPELGGQTLYYPPDTVDADDPRLLGSKLNVWCDGADAETEQEVADHIAPRLRVIAQKTWESPLPVPTYEEFQTLMAQVGSPQD